MAARRDRSKHGGGELILIQEHILFEEIYTTDFSIAEKAELIAITIDSLLFACCYRQPSSADVTLITKLDCLLDRYPSTSPIICGDFNVYESTWLQSSHTSSAGQQHWTFVNLEAYINGSTFQLDLMQFWM